MTPTVYIETSVVSFLTARPSPQLIVAAQQQATREWWEQRRQEYEVFVSEVVLIEASRGNVEAAARRIEALMGIQKLEVGPSARSLSRTLIDDIPLPPNAEVDALHIAVAAANRIDFLLTWNCRHIANPRFRYRIEELCREHGFEPPVICTPLDLLPDET